MNTPTSIIEINPAITPVGSVIWLHGLGADGHDFAPIIPELKLPANLPLRFAFPHAPLMPVTINNGYVMRAWYDIVSLNIDQRADQKGVAASVQQIQALIRQEEERGIPANKIVLAGFSQGAVIALTTGLTYPQRLAGILALSGYLPQGAEIFPQAAPANKDVPIFLGHGTEDRVVPYMLGEQVRQLLEQQHYTVSWHAYRMAHSVCKQEIEDIAEWLKKIFL